MIYYRIPALWGIVCVQITDFSSKSVIYPSDGSKYSQLTIPDYLFPPPPKPRVSPFFPLLHPPSPSPSPSFIFTSHLSTIANTSSSLGLFLVTRLNHLASFVFPTIRFFFFLPPTAVLTDPADPSLLPHDAPRHHQISALLRRLKGRRPRTERKKGERPDRLDCLTIISPFPRFLHRPS